MDPVVSYLVETEKRVKTELSELFQKIQVEQTATAYKSIVDLYDVPEIPVGDKHPKITYSPCVQIEFLTGGYDTKLYPNSAYRNCNCGRMKFTSEFKLPDHEKILRVYLQVEDDQNNRRQTGTATFITNYGRVIKTLDSTAGWDSHMGWTYSCYEPMQNGVEVKQSRSTMTKKITQLDPLPYKIPKWCVDTVLSVETLNESELQRISKDVFVFVGRWKDHITQHVTLDTEQLLSIKNEQAQRISVLEEAKKDLEAEDRFNKTLVKKLQERVAVLEQQTKQLPELKSAVKEVITFMNKQNGKSDCDYVQGSFSGFMYGKTCIPEGDLAYYEGSLEELKEFKIAERVRNRGIRELQGEVRNGMRGMRDGLQDIHRMMNE